MKIPKTMVALTTALSLLLVMMVALTPACVEDHPQPEPTVTLSMLIQTPDHVFDRPPPWWSERHRYPYTRSIDLIVHDTEIEVMPVAGVRVALDLPDGTRLGEADSDAEGRVEIDVPEHLWLEGAAAIATAYKDGFIMYTLAEVTRPTSDEPLSLTMFRVWDEAPDMVMVTGQVQNHANWTKLSVNTTAPCGSWFNANTTDWSLMVPVNTPFDIIATDLNRYPMSDQTGFDQPISQWARISSDGIDEDTVMDINFRADRASHVEFEGFFELPDREDSPLRQPSAGGNGFILAPDSYWGGVIGFATSTRNDGSTVEYTGEAVLAREYGHHWFAYFMYTPSLGMSEGYGWGLPDGQQPPLLDLPNWADAPQTVPDDQSSPMLTWEIFDEGVTPYIWIFKGDEVVWVVETPEDATTAYIPAPPSNVDRDALLGTAPSMRVALERRINNDDGVFWLESWGTVLQLLLSD